MIRAAVPILLLCLSLVAGCSGDTSSGSSSSAGTALTGRYEGGGEGERRNQLCLIERENGPVNFGLIAWGRGDANCSGSGTVRRDQDRLRLLLDGDEACVIEARVDGSRIAVSSPLSEQCARYYCGPGADLSAAEFQRVADGEAEARKPTDLTGDPLCAG